ncbi:hypothetical protein FHG87_018744 [Trinorchestia longiramus]|nr:hypothetical protein FHG87_018744 [Trinorchestia longiramus]
MAQMEEIMQRISGSRGSGLPLTQVLTPLQLQLLQQAEDEEDQSVEASSRRPAAPGASETAQLGDDKALTNQQRAQAVTNESTARVNTCGRDEEDEHQSWSAMQRQLIKPTTTGHPVNDDASNRPSKLAPDKQEGWTGTTPQQHQQRLSTIANLQEELRRKKNALEDLMR